ncbi:MAG: deoxyribonuclease V [Anaerolineales bacterium]|nr:deoxyribonuclease V [Anaerolineales bacterium]
MSISPPCRLHSWDLTPQAAIQLQNELRHRVQTGPLNIKSLRTVAGVDVSFPRGQNIARAAVVVLAFPSLARVDQARAEIAVPFPYMPGLLSFQEMPVILAALDKLHTRPDLWLVDGHGWAHPRRFGLACHLGVWLDQPAVGCGKSILVGEHAELPPERGSQQPLTAGGQVIGAALRTRSQVKPIYVSVGHRVDLPGAIEVVLACGVGYRLPEPTRQADHLAGQPF